LENEQYPEKWVLLIFYSLSTILDEKTFAVKNVFFKKHILTPSSKLH